MHIQIKDASSRKPGATPVRQIGRRIMQKLTGSMGMPEISGKILFISVPPSLKLGPTGRGR